MKVFMVNTEYARGGAARVTRALHSAFNSLPGSQSFFAYGKGAMACDSAAKRFAFQPEVYFHALISRVSGIQGYGTCFSTRRFLQMIIDWKPDVIHMHNLHGYFLDLDMTRKIGKLEIPVVWTLHDGWILTGRCCYLRGCDRWKRGCGDCPNLGYYPKTFIDSSSVMWKNKRKLLGDVWNPVLVSPSKWLAEKINHATGGKRHVEIIPNGVNTKIFKPLEKGTVRGKLGLPEGKKIIIFTASDLSVKEKGAKYFFESLQFIDAEDFMVVTIGKPVDLPAEVKSKYEVIQLGYISERQKMAEAYNVADIFCMTSLEDNFPRSVLESMSCGIPVVGFYVGGIPEQISEGCGKLVDAKDSKALGIEMSDLLKQDKLRLSMGKRCREKAICEYNNERFLRRYSDLYQELIDQKLAKTKIAGGYGGKL